MNNANCSKIMMEKITARIVMIKAGILRCFSFRILIGLIFGYLIILIIRKAVINGNMENNFPIRIEFEFCITRNAEAITPAAAGDGIPEKLLFSVVVA